MLGNDDSSLRHGKGMSRVASAPACSVDTLLPCDDVELEAADNRSRPKPGSRPGTGFSGTATSWSSFDSGSPSKSRYTPGDLFDERGCHSPKGRRRKGLRVMSKEELQCFRRVPTPSAQCSGKADLYFQTVGRMKLEMTESGAHTLPNLKGQFYKHCPLLMDGGSSTLSNPDSRRSVKVALLPDELMTSKVLNDIWPRTPGKREDCEATLSRPRSREKMISPTSTLGQSGEELLKASRSLRFNPNKTLSLDATIGSIGTPPGTAAQDPKTPSAKARSPTGGAPNNPEFDGFLRLAGPITPLAAMMAFRKVLIEKYHSMEEAVKLLCAELDDPNVMTKKDYRRYLQKYALNLSREERDAVYSHLDLDGDGDVSMAEMDLAIQAASPVRDLFDLRRRLLAGGISSLGQALRIADNVGISLTDRLSLRQFGEGLYHLYVSEHEEHLVLFNAVLDPNDPHSRVALPELIAALATLSPAMLVEDVREKLRRGKYDGNFERAFADLDLDQRGWVEKEDFVENAVLRFGLQEYEAKKMYRQIDVDESGRITRKEFLSSMALSEPNLFLEELRRKVLQRFRSIQTAFTKAFVAEIMAQEEDKKEGRDAKPLAGTLEKFQEMLLEVGLSEEETARLFSLIDIDGTGSLTVVQFVKGTLMFAPSWAFEDLRLQCLARNHEVAEIFADVEVSTTLALDLEAFSEILKELGLAEGVDVLAIFDMLDVMHDGQTTLGKLVAALQAGGPGTAIRLSDDDVVVYSKHDARNCTNSANRLVTDLKSLVRQNIDYSSKPVEVEDKDVISPSERARQERLAMVESMPLGSLRKSVAEKMKRLFGSSGGLNSGNQAGQRSTSTTDSAASSGGTSPKGRTKKIMSMGHRSPAQNDKSENERKKENENPRKATPAILKKVPPEDIKYYLLHQATYPAAGPPKPPPNPRNPQESYTPSMNMMGDNQTAWNQVWNRLHTASGQKDRQELEKEIHNYFQAGTWRLSHDVPLLEKVESRHAVHTDARRHAHALETEKQKIVYKAEKQAAAGSETRA